LGYRKTRQSVGSPRALFIGSDPTVAKSALGFLEGRGYGYVVVQSVKGAFKKLVRDNFHFTLLDLTTLVMARTSCLASAFRVAIRASQPASRGSDGADELREDLYYRLRCLPGRL